MQICSAYLISHTQAVLVSLTFKLNYCISQNDFPIPSVSSVQLLSGISLQPHELQHTRPPKERQCQRMLKLPHSCTHLTH